MSKNASNHQDSLHNTHVPFSFPPTGLCAPVLSVDAIVPCSSELALRADRPVAPQLLEANIVFVDDEIAVTQIVNKTLRDAGFQCLNGFNDPREAIGYISKLGADVVLLDLSIPDIDGISVLKFLRSHKTTKFVPVIILTSRTDEESRLRALTAGANEYLTKPVNSIELVQRVQNALRFKQYADNIENQISIVERELHIDPLTEINNRRSFDDYYSQKVGHARHNLSLTLIDIDNFKITNDTYGHQVGDDVLRSVACAAQSSCGPADFVARIGGDEFAIVSDHEDPDWPRTLSEQIRDKVLAMPVTTEDRTIETTISIGIASVGKALRDKGKLFNSADAALYLSKRQGRNAINVYSDLNSTAIGDTYLKHVPRLEDSCSPLNAPHEARILVVDDEPTVTRMLEHQLHQAGYQNVEIENDASQAAGRICDTLPDLVIMDIRMPEVNGLEVLRAIREPSSAAQDIPVLIMTSGNDEPVRVAALKLQANDFLTKPVRPAELDVRVVNLLRLKMQREQLLAFSEKLAHEVEVRTNELFATRRETILCLARAAESRDIETGNHVIRVGNYAAIIARQMGLDEDYVGWIELAAQLHDVGKLSIPDAILNDSDPLTDDPNAVIQTHCRDAERIFFGKSGDRMLTPITSPLLRMAARIAATHHERWDGTGYPDGLSGRDIPVEGRITAVADVFDALSSQQNYQEAYTVADCFDMIRQGSGSRFDPAIVSAFLDARELILESRQKWMDADADSEAPSILTP